MNCSIDHVQNLRTQLESIILGQSDMIDMICTALFARGHILVEAVPGMGKTKTARVLGRLIQGDFKRIQFTPDLMPGDIIGTTMYSFQSKHFEIVKGPVFAHIILADEINRSPAKTQSALLQAMEERKVTIAGKDLELSDRFLVIATQNPLEMEGTYPLPEAQLDRFMLKIELDYPSADEEKKIYTAQMYEGKDNESGLTPIVNETVIQQIWKDLDSMIVDDKIVDYVTQLVGKTRNYPGIAFGVSPRAGIHLLRAARSWALIRGRDYVIPEDIRDLAIPVLAHRLILEPESEIEGLLPSDFIRKLLNEVVVYS